MKKIFLLGVLVIIISSSYSQSVEEYNEEGISKVYLRDYKGAIDDFTKAIEIKPDYSAYINRGVAREKLQDYSGAIIDYTKAIEIVIDTNFAVSYIKRREAYKYRGYAKVNLQDYKGAIDDYTKAIEIGPDYATYYNRGIAKGNLQDYEGAIDDFTKVIEIKSNFAEAYCNRGYAKINLGRTNSGCLDLRKAGELGSEKANIAFRNRCKYYLIIKQ